MRKSHSVLLPLFLLVFMVIPKTAQAQGIPSLGTGFSPFYQAGDNGGGYSFIGVSHDSLNTTTSISSSPNPSDFGAPVTFTVRVTSTVTGSIPTGMVTIMDGLTTICTGTLSNGSVSCILPTILTTGSHSITAVYQGGSGVNGTLYFGSTSSALTHTVTATTTSTCTSTATASYAGTYTASSGFTITLTQAGTTLTGTFSSGSLSGNLGGFVDSSGRAYVWAWFDSQTSGSAALAGSLSISGNQGTFSFGGGQGSGGRISDFVLSNMTKQ